MGEGRENVEKCPKDAIFCFWQLERIEAKRRRRRALKRVKNKIFVYMVLISHFENYGSFFRNRAVFCYNTFRMKEEKTLAKNSELIILQEKERERRFLFQ